MILAVEVVSICATIVPMFGRSEDAWPDLKNGPDGLLEGASPSDTVTTAVSENPVCGIWSRSTSPLPP